MNILAFLPRSRRKIRAEVDEELAYHLEQRRLELERGGVSSPDAHEQALARFGELSATRNVCIECDERTEARMRRSLEWSDIAQDVRIALRQLLRRPGFSVTALFTLALGIGAATTVFSVTDRVLLRPLPYHEAERVVTVWGTDRSSGLQKAEVTPGEFAAWSESGSASFAAWGLAEPFGYDITVDVHPEPVTAWHISSGFLDALGVRPMLGSGFMAEDYSADRVPAVLLSHALWTTRFGGDAAIVGRTIQLDGGGVVVRGVMPPDIDYPEPVDVWTPRSFGAEERTDFESDYLFVVARLAPTVTAVRAQAELAAISARVDRGADADPDRGVNVVPLSAQVLGPARPALAILSAAVGLLLLIACSNVASLMIARNHERGREIAVRAALGAGRGRLLRHMLTEAAVLIVLAGSTGVVLARIGTSLIATLAPPELPRSAAATLDARVMLFALCATCLVFLVTGVPSAWRGARLSLSPMLRAAGRGMHGARETRGFRHVLVTVQLALALVLLVGAGLLARSFVELLSNDLGFDPTNRATVQVFLWDRNPTAEERIARVAQLSRAFETVPGVLRVGATNAAPFHPHRVLSQSPVTLPGAADAGALPSANGMIATPGLFDAAGIAVLQGRAFTDSDRMTSARVAVLNATAAKRYFGGESPLGRKVLFGVMARAEERTIVGVIADTRSTTIDADVQPEIWIPYAQSGNGAAAFVIQTASDARSLMPRLRDAVWSIDPGQAIYYDATIEELMSETLAARRFYLQVMATFASIALILAAVGLYGLIAFATRQRTTEIGVRLALGAHTRQVLGMLVREGLLMAVPGLLLGTAAAIGLTRFLQSMLYGVPAHDPHTFAIACAVLLLLAAVGAFIPARRAVRSDPVRSLRAD